MRWLSLVLCVVVVMLGVAVLGRYEIKPGAPDNMLMYRLDRWTGQTWRLQGDVWTPVKETAQAIADAEELMQELRAVEQRRLVYYDGR